MFKNKHIIIALLVSPILAVLAYFATDQIVGEKAAKAEPGKQYQLIAESKCRYASGICTMKNGNFSITITAQQPPQGGQLFTLRSEFPLQSADFATATPSSSQSVPQPMQRIDDVTFEFYQPENIDEQSSMRIVLSASGSIYYGESTIGFL
ncbi:hypothetical protein SIN8267_00391 [Sinobacterium norvegicum]|uniref:Uncharacterized protein n=1 Tax=Sinobacterium norvegicum TaxID=1641715 RepID=A0ABN8ECV8_9GAMM|nr:hypothetical protein [Sinobacterium norvegicum]CAH0990299.1 hypothetical protein SIN8267_00391 [Sinobacterium norvegicum]